MTPASRRPRSRSLGCARTPRRATAIVPVEVSHIDLDQPHNQITAQRPVVLGQDAEGLRTPVIPIA
jgi:hypothetical protein